MHTTVNKYRPRYPVAVLLQVLSLLFIMPQCGYTQELSFKGYGFSNTSSRSALSDRATDLDLFPSTLTVAGAEYAHRLSDKWSVYAAVSTSRILVTGDEGPLRWPAEIVDGVYVDDVSWPNYRTVQEEGHSIVLSFGGRRYFDIGKKSLVPFVSTQADLHYNYRLYLSDRYFNRGIRSFNDPPLQPQFRRWTSETIDKQKSISAGIVALFGLELRLGTLLTFRAGWAVRADLLDYARDVDYLRTFARGITLQAGIDLPTAKRAFFPNSSKKTEE